MQTLSRASRRLFPFVIGTILALTALTGCSERRAGMKLTKAAKVLQEAKDHGAETFAAEDTKNVEAKLAEAQGKAQAADFDNALIEGASALDAAEALLATTMQLEATSKQTIANADVEAAGRNQGNMLNESLNNSIIETQQEAQELYDKGKFEKSTGLYDKIHSDVAALLQGKRATAEEELADAKAKYDVLVGEVEKGKTEAPTETLAVEVKIAELEKMSSLKQRQYGPAHKLYEEEAIVLLATATNAARSSRTRKMQENLANKIQRSITEEAPKFLPEDLKRVQEMNVSFLKFQTDSKYAEALTEAATLEPMLDTLILNSRQTAARDRIKQVENGIRALDVEKVRNYLPDRLEVVDGLLAKAGAEFTDTKYNVCKDTCDTALSEEAAITRDFKMMADREILAATSELDQADNFLQKMAGIFKAQAEPIDDPLAQAFENKKMSLKSQLDTIKKSAEGLLALARVDSEEQHFSGAIENARMVTKKAARVIHDVYQVVAHNTIVALASAISAVEDDGAVQFAPVELAATKEGLARARKMMSDVDESEKAEAKETGKNITEIDFLPNAYKPTAMALSEVRAELETVYHRMKEYVTTRISEARSAIAQAETNKASTFALGGLTTSRQTTSQAEKLLTEGSHYAAAKKAQEARKIAQEADVKAIRSWASQEAASAQAELQKARQAEADEYDAPRFEKVLKKDAEARLALEKAAKANDPAEASALFKEGKDLAVQAGADAKAARMAPITKSSQIITDAKQYGAWDHDYSKLVGAIVQAKAALAAMEAGDYEKSNMLARQAAQLANRAMEKSKKTGNKQRMAKVAVELDETMDEGAIYVSQQDILALFDRMQDLKGKYSTKDHDTIQAEVDQLEKEMFRVAREAPGVFEAMLAEERAIHDDLVKRGAKRFANDYLAEASQNLRYARTDFNKGEFRSSSQNLKRAASILASVDNRLAAHQFADEALGLFRDLEEAQRLVQGLTQMMTKEAFRTLATRNDSSLMRGAVLTGSKPVDFAREVISLQAKSQALPHPPGTEKQHARVVDVFDTIRRSSEAFEKFPFLDTYKTRTANALIDQAFDLLAESEKKRKAVTSELEEKGLLPHLDLPKRLSAR